MLAYDSQIHQQSKKIIDLETLLTDIQQESNLLASENEDLRTKLEVKIKDYSDLLAKTIENSEIITNYEEDK